MDLMRQGRPNGQELVKNMNKCPILTSSDCFEHLSNQNRSQKAQERHRTPQYTKNRKTKFKMNEFGVSGGRVPRIFLYVLFKGCHCIEARRP